MDRKAIIEVFEKTHTIMHKLAEEMKVDEKYSHVKSRTLLWLDRNGKKKLKDIAAQTGMSTSSLCVMFNEMEKESLVLREIDKNDRRNTYYSLSENGKIAAAEIEGEIKEAIVKIFEPLSESEMADIIKSFGTINKILEKYL